MTTTSLLTCSALAGVVAATSIISNLRVSIVRSLGYFRQASTAAAINVALINIVWAAAAGRSWDVHAVLVIQALANLALTGVWWVLAQRALAFRQLEEGAEPTAREIVTFAATGSVSAAGQSLLLGGDKVSLAAVSGLSGLPAYSIPFAMASRVNLVGASMSTVLFPRLGGDSGDVSRRKDDLLGRWSTAVTIAFSGAITTTLLVVGPHFFRLWLGGKVGQQAGGPVRALAVGFFFFTVGQIGYAINDAAGGIRRTACAFLVGGTVAPFAIGAATAANGITTGAYTSSAFIGLVGLGGMYLGRSALPTAALLWSLLGLAAALAAYLGLGAIPGVPEAAAELAGASVALTVGAASLVQFRRGERALAI
jgi:O-antigen/teichoic acid export membrane protein